MNGFTYSPGLLRARNLADLANVVTARNNLGIGATNSVQFSLLTLDMGGPLSPSINFSPYAQTGIFAPGANQIGFCTSGTERIRIAGAQFLISSGTVGAPGLSFLGDTANGIFRTGSNQWCFAQNGAEILRLNGNFHIKPTVGLGNVIIGAAMTAGASALGVIALQDGTAPSSSPTGGGQIYCEAGALKYRGSGGTVTTLGPA